MTKVARRIRITPRREECSNWIRGRPVKHLAVRVTIAYPASPGLSLPPPPPPCSTGWYNTAVTHFQRVPVPLARENGRWTRAFAPARAIREPGRLARSHAILLSISSPESAWLSFGFSGPPLKEKSPVHSRPRIANRWRWSISREHRSRKSTLARTIGFHECEIMRMILTCPEIVRQKEMSIKMGCAIHSRGNTRPDDYDDSRKNNAGERSKNPASAPRNRG